MTRNLSINTLYRDMAQRHRPEYRFEASDEAGWKKWKDDLLPRVRASLGRMPERVALNPEVIAEWREDGLIKQKIVLDVERGLSATAYVFRPENAQGRLPAILCCHGHGEFGKEPVMGNRSSPEMSDAVDRYNYDYGLKMAQHGYVTIAIDWHGFGDRDDRGKPNWNAGMFAQRDPCNLHYLRASLLGMTVLGMDVHDGSRALDYLCDQPFVDPDRIGVMGLSFGGTMTVWMSLCDDRIKAADVICYSGRFADFAMRDINFCGSQITPGLFALCDVPDLQGLIAPRPLLVEIGAHDTCFTLDDAMSCQRELEKIYAAAGLSDRLELDLFEGGHAWGGNRSAAFFDRWLAG